MSSSSEDLSAARQSSSAGKANRKRKGPAEDGAPRLCCLCHQRDVGIEEEPVGPLLELDNLRAHYHCLLFSSNLGQRGRDDEGLRGFLPSDIRAELKRGARLKCVYCKLKGATVGCALPLCKKSYHLPCGARNRSLQQHYDQYKSYCCTHRPVQKKTEKSRKLFKECVFCLERVAAADSASALYAPCCVNGWMHRKCVQEEAYKEGGNPFRCPLCSDQLQFKKSMLKMGIIVPDRGGGRRQVDAERVECNAKVCLCEQPTGRRANQPGTPLQVVPCHACRSRGIHVICGGLEPFVDPHWYCYSCRREVEPEDRPIVTKWGSASALKAGETLRSDEKRKADLIGDITAGSSSEPSSTSSVQPPSQSSSLMSVTLEDIIVSRLEQRQTPPRGGPAPATPAVPDPAPGGAAASPETSPGDSDYESESGSGSPRNKAKKKKTTDTTSESSIEGVIKKSITDLFLIGN